jgi:DNA-binding beta-propeller fold protein YncE
MATGRTCVATIAAAALLGGFAVPPAADAAGGFGPLSGAGGCLVAPGSESADAGTKGCAAGNGLSGAKAVAVSPDGANVYVVGGVAGNDVAMSFGAVAILKRDAATGAIAETGCLSSDGTDGRDGASGACAVEPSLLGARGVAVSPDGSTVYVSSSSSASVVAFSRNSVSGSLTRLGCFQGTPRPGAPCGAANLLASSSGLAASADGSALYVAAPLEGAISSLDTAARLRTPTGIVPALGAATPTSTTAAPTSGASATSTPSGAGAAASPRPLAAIFTTSLAGTELLNPCIAVNGLDGVCAVGTATQGLGDLALSPDGKQLYGAAPGSKAIDVFTPETGGALAETSCVKVDAPPGLCSAAALMNEPSELATSPDGKNVYAADSVVSLATGRVDVLSRNSTTGALSTSGCVEYQAPPPKPEPEEEGEEEGEAKKASAAAGQCASAPGLNSVSVVAVSGDGSSVYAIGSGSAAIFSRNAATGALTETSCAAENDERCTSLPALSGVTGAAVSPDGREVYVVASRSSAVMVFGVGAAVTTGHTAATGAGTARVSVTCPAGLRNACTGRVDLTRAVAHAATTRHARRVRVRRLRSGHSGVFSIKPGHRASVEVRLTAPARHLLQTRRRLRLMAVVHAAPAAGGSGYGRHVLLALGRP